MKLTTNYSLKKPEGSDVVNIDDFNYNADIIDNAIQEVKGKIDSLELVASNVKMVDGTTVEDTVTTNKTSISNLQSDINNIQRKKLTHDDGRYLQTRDNGDIDVPFLGWANYFNAKGTLPNGYNPEDNDFLIENKGVGNDWIRQILYDVRSYNSFVRMRTNGTWSEWREL